jgi:hypothetical protein
MIKYKTKHGDWPELNMSTDKIEIQRKSKRYITNLNDLIEVIDMDIEEVLHVASLSGAEYLLCNDFMFTPYKKDDFTISFSGQEIDSEINEEIFKNFLDSYEFF